MADKSISIGAEFIMELRDEATNDAKRSMRELNKILRDTIPEQERFAKADQDMAKMEELLAEKMAAGTVSIQAAAAAMDEILARHPRQVKAAKEAADAAEANAKRQAEAARKLAEEQKEAARQAAATQREEARKAAEAQRAEMIRVQREASAQAKAIAAAQRQADREARAAQVQAAREMAAQQRAIAKQSADQQREAMRVMVQQNQAMMAQMKAGQGDIKAALGQLPIIGRFAGVMGPATAGLAAFAVAAGVVKAQVELMSTAIGYASDNIRKAYEALDETADAAEDLGIKANALRQLQLQAELAEVSTETLRNSLKKMMVNLGEAADDPRGGAAKLFTKLRLDATELANAKPEVAFEKIMTAIEDLPTRAQQLNAINDIFGRGNTEIIRLIGSYEKYRDLAKELATTLTDEQTAAQDEAQASFRLLKIVMEETWKETAKDIIPAVGELAKVLTELLRDKDARDTFIAAFQDIAGVMKIVAESGDTVAGVLGKIIRALQEIGPAGKALAQIVLPQPLRVPFAAATTAAGLLPSQQQVEALRRNREAEAFIQKQIDKENEVKEAAERAAKAVRGLDAEFSALVTGPTLGGGAFSLFDGVGDRIKKMTEDQEKFLQQIREQNELIGKTREEQEQIRFSRITALAGAMDALKAAQDERAEKEKIAELDQEALQATQDQVKEAENLRRSLMTRDEKAQENIAKWRDLAKQGLLFDFELQKLIDRELGGLGTGKAPEVPSTLRAGSAEAYRAMFYKSTKTTDDILKRIEKNTRPDQAGEKLQLVNEGIA